jgi:hypothetical protein
MKALPRVYLRPSLRAAFNSEGACQRPSAGDAMPRSLSRSAALRSGTPSASAVRMFQSRGLRSSGLGRSGEA